MLVTFPAREPEWKCTSPHIPAKSFANCVEPLGLTVTEAAAALGVTRKAFSDLVNGHSGVSPEMAIRLEKLGWSSADHWLEMQLRRDLWLARRRAGKIRIRKQLLPRSAGWPTPG